MIEQSTTGQWAVRWLGKLLAPRFKAEHEARLYLAEISSGVCAPAW